MYSGNSKRKHTELLNVKKCKVKDIIYIYSICRRFLKFNNARGRVFLKSSLDGMDEVLIVVFFNRHFFRYLNDISLNFFVLFFHVYSLYSTTHFLYSLILDKYVLYFLGFFTLYYTHHQDHQYKNKMMYNLPMRQLSTRNLERT